MIVTWNVRDFAQAELDRYSLRKLKPDAFLLELFEAHPAAVAASVENARVNLSKSKLSPDEYMVVLRRQKLGRFVDALEAWSKTRAIDQVED